MHKYNILSLYAICMLFVCHKVSLPNVSPVFLSKYKTTLCPMISQVPSVLFISPDFSLYCSHIPLPN